MIDSAEGLALLMAKNGIRHAKQLAKEIDVTEMTINNLLNNRTSRYDAPVLGKLCHRFGCQVGDILKWIPDEQKAAPTS